MEACGKKRMKGILLTNLIVGHTHDKVDRFFSRIRAVLAGIDYFTWQQVRDLLMVKMRGFNMEMEHLTTAWCWKELDALGLPPLIGQRNVHCLNIFRHCGCIWVKWKQYMTSKEWSRPVLYVSAADVARIASFRPTAKPLAFSNDQQVMMLSWVDKLAVFLTDSHDTISKHRDDLQWLRHVITGRCIDPSLCKRVDINHAIVALLRHADKDPLSAPCEPERVRPTDVLPPDQLVQLFPGADIPEYPTDALVHVPGLSAAPPVSNLIGPGSMVICKSAADSRCRGQRLQFLLARVLPQHNANADADVLVEWWLPSMAKESSLKPGKKKEVIDIFGPWHGFTSFAAVDIRDTHLPSVLVRPGDILINNVVLEKDGKIPFAAFDRLRNRFEIDVTALSASATQNGGVYRSYVLMRLNRSEELS